MTQVVWHGTDAESQDLINAIARNCTCEFGGEGERVTTCASHDALLHDQRFLNGLLDSRRRQARMVAEEWCVPKKKPKP